MSTHFNSNLSPISNPMAQSSRQTYSLSPNSTSESEFQSRRNLARQLYNLCYELTRNNILQINQKIQSLEQQESIVHLENKKK